MIEKTGRSDTLVLYKTERIGWSDTLLLYKTDRSLWSDTLLLYKIERSLRSDTLSPCKIYWSFRRWKVFVSFRTPTVLPVATCGMLDECNSYRWPVQVKLNRGWARKCPPCCHSLRFSRWSLRTASNLYKVGCGLYDECFRMIEVVGSVICFRGWGLHDVCFRMI